MGERYRIADRALAILLVVALGPLPVGCRGKRDPGPASGPPESTSSGLPVDKLLPGEVAAGSEDAFGLPVPRSMKVRARFVDAVFAAGALSPEQVAGYVRERVVAEHVEAGLAKTVFARVTVKGVPQQKTLRIEVISQGSETSLVVRDETRPPAKEGLTEEERWRELGLTPQGAPLDPTQLE